jgi:hypothetical protein
MPGVLKGCSNYRVFLYKNCLFINCIRRFNLNACAFHHEGVRCNFNCSSSRRVPCLCCLHFQSVVSSGLQPWNVIELEQVCSLRACGLATWYAKRRYSTFNCAYIIHSGAKTVLFAWSVCEAFFLCNVDSFSTFIACVIVFVDDRGVRKASVFSKRREAILPFPQWTILWR